MSGESNADVYASFGVNSSVMTGGSVEEHEQNMLALDVAARDGDDSIDLVDTSNSDDPYGSNVDPFADPDSLDDGEGRMQIRVSEDGEQTELEAAEDQFSEVTEEQVSDEFESLGNPPQELTDAASELQSHEAGFHEMVEQATDRGMTAESIARIQEEYSGDGLSEESYAELAKAGYSKGFVDSYIKGQEALVDRYVDQIKGFAGGPEKFDAILAHLEATNPEAAESLFEAMESRNMGTMKAILNLAGESHAKKFGKPQSRSLTTRATPAKPAASAKKGFESQAEMVKAMSDSRYRTDASYRRSVEQRIIDSQF